MVVGVVVGVTVGVRVVGTHSLEGLPFGLQPLRGRRLRQSQCLFHSQQHLVVLSRIWKTAARTQPQSV